MKFFKEFKEFIKKGNVLDLAVALLIGSAFTAIVNSLANDVIMPPISILLGFLGGQELKWVIRRESVVVEDGIEKIIPEIAINYGSLIQAILNFLILALCVFIIVKLVTRTVNGAKERKEKIAAVRADETLSKEEKRSRINAIRLGKDIEAAPAAEEAEPASEEPTEPAPAPETQEDILRDIRELLKANAEKQAAAGVAPAAEKPAAARAKKA